MFRTLPLTRSRIRLAYAVAVAADALQLMLMLLPLAWTSVDQVIDVVAMILTVALLGFHPLLLPTFIIEFIPLVDMLPTWIGCVALVVSLRKKQQTAKPPKAGPIIDV